MSKRYLTEKPSTVELMTDPAQWEELQAIRVIMLLADREASTLGDPFGTELLSVKENNITGTRLKFSSLEQNVPGFSLMFVLLTLVFSVCRSASGRKKAGAPAGGCPSRRCPAWQYWRES